MALNGSRDTPRSLILWTIAMVVLAIVICWSLYLARHVVLLVYVSMLFAIGFSPLVRLLERQKLLPIGTRRLPRWLAILTIYLAIIGFVTGLAAMIVPPLIFQAQELYRALPGMLEKSQAFLLEHGIISHPITLKDALRHAPGAGDTVGTVFLAVTNVVGGAFGIVTVLILTFYLLIEAESLFSVFVRLFPPQRQQRIAALSREITLKVSAWLGGQLLLGLVIGTTAAIGLWLLGVPYFYVLALIAGVGELIPMVGPILAAIPAIIVALTVSPMTGLATTIFFIAQQQFENHILVPKIMERQVGVSAVTVIIALLFGGSLLGLVGALLAVPTAAILQVVLTELTESNTVELAGEADIEPARTGNGGRA